MIELVDITYTRTPIVVTLGVAFVMECDRCGAPVLNIDKHTNWHQENQ